MLRTCYTTNIEAKISPMNVALWTCEFLWERYTQEKSLRIIGYMSSLSLHNKYCHIASQKWCTNLHSYLRYVDAYFPIYSTTFIITFLVFIKLIGVEYPFKNNFKKFTFIPLYMDTEIWISVIFTLWNIILLLIFPPTI